MPPGRVQFRVSDLLAATSLFAAILVSAVYLPSTYKTEGAVGSFVASLPIVLVWIAGGVCFCFRRLRLPAVFVTLLVCLAFSFRQAWLMERLRQLEVEVPRIVAYVETYKKEHEGACPEDLSGYVFERPELRPNIRYLPPQVYNPRTQTDASPYAVRFHPNARSDVSHWYTSSGGYWYDDD
jgi:hypothetical protein